MEKTRTLPPLVRGRVTGVLDFFAEEIRLGNASIETDNLVLRVQWWGEDSPVYVRPLKLPRQQSRVNSTSAPLRTHSYSTRYEINTTLDLFKSYLRTSEVLELCVLDAIKNIVIGSAFLKDLVDLLKKTNHIALPIFDYLGEEIGEVLVTFSFLQKPREKVEEKREEISLTGKRRSESQDFSISNKSRETHPNCLTPAEKNAFYGEPEANNGGFPKDFWLSLGKELCEEEKINRDDRDDFPVRSQTMGLGADKSEERTDFCKCLPEITNSSDSSKVLYFGLNSQKSKQKTNRKVINKFNSNSIKFKSKKADKEIFLPHKPSTDGIRKETCQVDSQDSKEKLTELHVEKQINVSPVDKSQRLNERQSECKTSLTDISSKESPEAKVLDYLLGSDLSKEEEESAVSEFRKMSPSQNLVTSINKLCLTSDSDSGNRHCSNSSEGLQGSCLSFNLDNPIERSYYEKFFLKSKPSLDLELAELLNKPENSEVVEKLKSSSVAKEKSVSHSSQLSERESQRPKRLGSSECLINPSGGAKGCARCKYYKKLEELDAIIESLKHFEKKMLSGEGGLRSALAGDGDLWMKSAVLG